MKHQFKARFALAAAAALSIGAGVALADGLKRTPSPAGAEVYFIAPADGATVTSPVTVKFGLKGMGIAPAGVEMPDTGHHHLLVDRDLPAMTEYLPTDNPQILHFGKGQTETELKLAPGKHTLQLVLADKDHKPHAPPVVSERITVVVK